MSTNKKRRTMFIWMLIIVLMTTMVHPVEHVTADESDYEWTENDDGGATITRYNGDGGDVVIPDTLGGLEVTEIASSAFTFKGLTKVSIPDSVTSIGSYAFALNELKEVTIGASVTEIGAQSFAYNKLTSVVIPNSVISIKGYAFQDNKLKEVIISDSVESIGDWAFAENNLTSVTIPDSVTSIGNSAFSFNELKEVTIPDSVTSIGNFAFADNQSTSADLTIYGYENSAAENYANRNGHTFINITTLPEYIYEWEENADGGATITGYNGDGGEIEIPDELDGLTVTEIQDKPRLEGVFENKGITSVILPENLKHVGNYAFRDNQLTKVVIPNRVKSIGISAFAANKITEVDIPDSVTNIEETAFSWNQLIEVVIPDSVTTIGEGAFHTNKLLKVSISDSVTSIEADAFAYNQLKEVIIPNNVTSIEDRAFYYNQLTQVIIPDSVTSIGIDAFGNKQSNPADLTIYGYAESAAATYATTNEHQFKAVNSPPEVDIHIDGILVDDLLSEDGVLSVDYGTKEELNAVYHHQLQDDDFVKLDIESVSWEIDGVPDPVKGNTLELESYTDIVGERTVTLTVETNYGGKGIKEVTLNIDPPVPSEPDLTMDEVTETSITLSWEHVDFAEEYILKRDEIEVYRGTELTFNDTGLTPNTSYRYSLVAVNKSGTSEEDAITATTALPVPETPALAIKEVTETSISLSWGSVQYAEEYILMRDGEEVYQGANTSFTDEELTPDTNYRYTLVASNDSGASAPSEEVIAKTALPVPETPTLSIEETTQTSISLSWDSVQYAEEYILKRDGEEIYQGEATSYEDTGLRSGTTYKYTLIAKNTSGNTSVTKKVDTNKSSNYRLKDLSISEGSLNPNFDPNTKQYTVRVPQHIDSLSVTAVTEDKTASVVINGQSVDSGQSSEAINLLAGEVKEIEIVVTAQDGTENTYTINVTRLASIIEVELDSDGQTVTISDERLYRLDQDGTLIIGLTEQLDGVSHVHLSQDQMQYLATQNATIRVYKDDIILNMSASNFSGEQSLTLTMERLEKNPDLLPALNKASSAVYDFTLKWGDQMVSLFDYDIELIFPVQGYENPERLHVYYWNDVIGEWEFVGGEYQEGTMHVMTSHFSTFAVFNSSVFDDDQSSSKDEDKDEVITDTDASTEDDKAEVPVDLDTSTEADKGEALPTTATQIYTWLLIGFILLFMGVTLYGIHRYRLKHQSNETV